MKKHYRVSLEKCSMKSALYIIHAVFMYSSCLHINCTGSRQPYYDCSPYKCKIHQDMKMLKKKDMMCISEKHTQKKHLLMFGNDRTLFEVFHFCFSQRGLIRMEKLDAATDNEGIFRKPIGIRLFLFLTFSQGRKISVF